MAEEGESGVQEQLDRCRQEWALLRAEGERLDAEISALLQPINDAYDEAMDSQGLLFFLFGVNMRCGPSMQAFFELYETMERDGTMNVLEGVLEEQREWKDKAEVWEVELDREATRWWDARRAAGKVLQKALKRAAIRAKLRLVMELVRLGVGGRRGVPLFLLPSVDEKVFL